MIFYTDPYWLTKIGNFIEMVAEKFLTFVV